jgi:hypothetical protein
MVVLIVEGGNTMTKYHEGQEVELTDAMVELGWPRRATIERKSPTETAIWLLRFPNGECLRVADVQIKGVTQ